MKMTKSFFLASIADLYRVGNIADHEDNPNKEWTRGVMAGKACCNHLDKMLTDLKLAGIITEEEQQAFYNNQ